MPLAIPQSARWHEMPDVPTVAEPGYPGLEVSNIFGVTGPKGIPKQVVQKVNGACLAASRELQLTKRVADFGVVIISSPYPDDLTKRA